MLERIYTFLSSRPPLQLYLGLPLLIAIIGALDLASGYEWSFSIFYVLPVSIGAWSGRKRLGLWIAIFSAATWFAVDRASGHPYSSPAIPYWNAGVRLGFFIIISSLLSSLRHALNEQRALAQHDGLTKLLNARTFQQRCEEMLKLSARHGHPLVLGYLDLDGFKGINDRLGHSVGDQVLKSVANIISSRLRSTDYAGRMGGDEFALLLPETNLVGAQIFFNQLHENLLELASTYQWQLGFSFGVAVFNLPTITTDEAIAHADALMYQVKQSGKNAIRFQEFPCSTNSID